MPFTFAHPAIVLPLTLLPPRWASATGLIVGSMTPDFEYFLRMKVQSEYSHSPWGLLWFCVPLGLMLAFLFHEVVKPALMRHLPAALQRRFQPFAAFNWKAYVLRHWPVVCMSVFLGAASHVVWDAFTHEHGYFVQAWPVFTQTVAIGKMEFPVFKLLQHGSTLAGMAAILLFVAKLPVGDGAVNKPDIRYWLAVLGWMGAIVAVRFVAGLNPQSYGNLVVTLIAAFLLALILTPIAGARRFRNVNRST